jgi:N-acetylglutamate synthase-like GNAT family acetyltransferase
MSTDEAELTVSEDATARDLLEDRLYEFNVAATGVADGRGLVVRVKSGDGSLIGAAAGHTWGGTCELRQLWVREDQRRRGWGARIMAAAELEARRRGCFQLVLTTHSFQAPVFYAKLGFECVFELPQYPRGHSQFVLRKALVSCRI